MTAKSLLCLGLAALPLLALAPAVAAGGDWVPTPAVIHELEADLTLGPSPPKGSRPPFATLTPQDVESAARFYHGVTYEGRRVIRGEILRSPDETPGIHIQSEMPLVMDGGCSVINLLYDPGGHRFIRFECNGVA